MWVVKGKTIGVLYFAFKKDTDDMRFAPSIDIISDLQKEGAKIKVYDPAMENAKSFLKVLFTAIALMMLQKTQICF